MMPPITFYAEGHPKGQPRPKAFSRGGHAAVYDPGTAEGWKSQVAIAAKPFLPTEPLACPLSLRLSFFMPRPKAHFRGKDSILRDTAPGVHTGTPDADNLAKAVMDALTQLGMWRDDGQVAVLTVLKSFNNSGPCGCEVTIKEIE